MALFHLSVTQTKRSAGQSAIASAAYRAGERLYSEYYGEYSDYTRKGGVICSDILLPSHAPKEYADRQTLWNAVEKAERGKTAQLAYSFDIALQNEFSLEENIALARQFLLEQFVSRGMVVDFAVHQPDREDGGIPNPHFHVLCPIRPIEQNGKWGCKQHRVYELDEENRRVLLDGAPLELTETEFSILQCLAQNRGRVVPVRTIYETVWHETYMPASNNTVMVHIVNLRKKLEEDPANPRLIRTVWGKGYQID